MVDNDLLVELILIVLFYVLTLASHFLWAAVLHTKKRGTKNKKKEKIISRVMAALTS